MPLTRRKRNLAFVTSKRCTKLLKKRRISEKEAHPCNLLLENYLMPNFTNKMLGSFAYEQCGIKYPNSAIYCHRKRQHEVRFIIHGRRTMANILWYQIIFIRKDCIGFYWSHGKQFIALRYTNKGKLIVRKQNQLLTFTKHNLWHTNIRFPRFVYHLIPHFIKVIKKTKRSILSYRNRTEDALTLFCPKLPGDISSLIWCFAISDGVLSSKLTCIFGQLLVDALEDRSRHWMKNLTAVLMKIIQRLKSTEIINFFQEESWRRANFHPLMQSTKEIYVADAA